MATKKAPEEPRPTPRAIAKVTGIPVDLIRRVRRGAATEGEQRRYFAMLVSAIGEQVSGTEKRLRGVERTMTAGNRKTRKK